MAPNAPESPAKAEEYRAKAREYRAKAREYEEQALHCDLPEVRASYLKLANSWRGLAEQVEWLETSSSPPFPPESN
jgi:hypothetical protein